MTDTLRTAIVYTAYLIDPHAYPTGSALPRLIFGSAAAQCVLAVLMLVRRVRRSAWFGMLALVNVLAVPAGLWFAGTRDASILTTVPLWLFCVLQLAVVVHWLATRRTRMLANLALFILLAAPCAGLLIAAHLVDPSHRTY
ncbi:hypothetical protein [Paraburkholderia rhizosphaerae]|uniref:Uncharacterized protein n=1 Tax=Paraburkholderia rhizosphaerae TaxID=480658 RepID=A0A4R8LWN6_9BURK|nr:hypothetical protein [Paraburkholderia rhizosphaerae]TDY52367.1 hypothetical protein BX592_105251 [Paraburkholderia rhizosphaerae]